MPTAPEQNAPQPTSCGADDHAYHCEICGDQVDAETHDLPAGRWGVIVRCQNHPYPYHQHPLERHPLDGVTAKRVDRDRHLPPIGSAFNLKPSERMDYGVTVTIRNTGTLHHVTLTGSGPVFDALADVVERIDEMNEDTDQPWRVVSVSTPGTIYSDLQGERDPYTHRPELRYLARLGRTDLLAPT